jgi:putative membrane protein
MLLHAAIFAFLHHLAAFTLVGVLVGQMILLNGELTLSSAKRLQRLDSMLGVAAVTLLVVGLLRVFYFEKGSDYYFGSAFFIAKLSLFFALGLLSIIPTIEFLRWRKATSQGQVPTVDAVALRRVRMVVHLELGGVVLILLCAAMMARGLTLF